MGIDGLGMLLRKQCPQVFRAFTNDDLVRKRIAIDMHIIVYQMFHRNGGNQEAVKADIRRFMDRLKHDTITPKFVFDGKTTGLKPRAHQMRREAFSKSSELLTRLKTETAEIHDTLSRAYSTILTKDMPEETKAEETTAVVEEEEKELSSEKLDELISKKNKLDLEIQKVGVRTIRPSYDLFRAIKSILTSEFGADAVMHAEDDGERQVAELCKAGVVDFAVSSDYDTLAFGSPNLVVNFLHPDKMSLLVLDEVITSLGFTDLQQMRDFCILCGCDFCEKIPGIGPVSALKMIRTYKSIENAYDTVLQPKITKSGVNFDYVFARRRFMGEAPEPPTEHPSG